MHADKHCDSPAISADGRFVVFDSTTNLLDPADTSTTRDVFRRDLVAGTTVLISYATNGRGGDRGSSIGRVTPDGNLVVFESTATNLVSGDFNNKSDVFVRDVAAGTTTRMSLSSSGTAGGDDSTSANITPDGAFVVFDSLSTNLVSSDTNAASDIFRRDRVNKITARVSLSDSDAEANGRSNKPSISADGNLVAFESRATSLGTADSNGYTDIDLRDIAAGTTRKISVGWNGSQPTNDCFDPQFSADGRFVAFDSAASNLAAGDSNGKLDCFLRDRVDGKTLLISRASDGSAGNGDSTRAVPSADGRFILFASFADNFTPFDDNQTQDVFLHDREEDTTDLVSVALDGTVASDYSEALDFSDDGRLALFQSSAKDLVAGSNANWVKTLLRDLQAGVTEQVSLNWDGSFVLSECRFGRMSDDGRFVTASSRPPSASTSAPTRSRTTPAGSPVGRATTVATSCSARRRPTSRRPTPTTPATCSCATAGAARRAISRCRTPVSSRRSASTHPRSAAMAT
ncbi:MAG: hypothetical protein EXS13_13705 [Planctomycetes bacterium]|nr:hypothetical protein [Planctomycetota bacterium]